MSSPPPSWSGYPPTSPPPYHHGGGANGHDSLALGTTLGRLLSGQDRTIFVLELINSKLEELPEKIAERLPQPPAPPAPPDPADRMTWRDWMQIGIALLVIAGALTGKLAPDKALSIIGKPFGF